MIAGAVQHGLKPLSGLEKMFLLFCFLFGFCHNDHSIHGKNNFGPFFIFAFFSRTAAERLRSGSQTSVLPVWSRGHTRIKVNLNWGHWIRFPVPAVSPHHASVWQTHHPSHLRSPLTGPGAASPWLSFIIPADWLVGHSHAGDLAGAKPLA